MTLDALTASVRFGLGPRAGELDAIGRDPAAWLLGQLAGPAETVPGADDLPATAGMVADFREARRQGRRGMPEARRELRAGALDVYRDEVAARVALAVRTARPFRERLVAFWANHFTVSIRRPELVGIAGAFEREAIRPNVTGRFRGLLGAVVRHPAMLLYLDNARSVGPGSEAGRERGRGLNENLARELMELHTLGVDSGYAQADVTQLARILTGWSVGGDGAFAFRERAHEPGAKVWLGRAYAEDGAAEGEAALDALAAHPATARHVATRLARHFAADDPPPALVERLARRFLDAGGDLAAVYAALVEAPECVAEPLGKVRQPWELMVAAFRALDRTAPLGDMLRDLRAMGQPPWGAPSPQGWPDRAADWVSPEALVQRASWAAYLAAAFHPDPRGLLAASLGPDAGEATRAAVLRAGSTAEATALLLASPEFQRR